MHHQDTIGHSEYFFHFAADEQDRHPFLGRTIHQLVNFFFCTDVDAAGWLIKQKNFRAQFKPFSEDDLLLIATGEELQHLVS